MKTLFYLVLSLPLSCLDVTAANTALQISIIGDHFSFQNEVSFYRLFPDGFGLSAHHGTTSQPAHENGPSKLMPRGLAARRGLPELC